MGGRIALHAALAAPTLVSRLVLIGATAGINDASERADRLRKDVELAAQLKRDGLSKFLDRWLSAPLFAGLSEEMACRPERLQNRTEGLIASLAHCGTGTQEPLWSRLGELAMPVLVVAGKSDKKFTEIAQRIAFEAVGTNVDLVAPEGTHAVHLEQPELVANAIRSFTARPDREVERQPR